MNFFNLFNAKHHKTRTMTLEQLLKEASLDSSFLDEFYNKLLTEKLICLTENDDKNNCPNDINFKQGSNIDILSFPDETIPIFTSADRILDNNIVNTELNYFIMPARMLFEITQGATLILNPYSNYAKELLPNEIKQLLQKIN